MCMSTGTEVWYYLIVSGTLSGTCTWHLVPSILCPCLSQCLALCTHAINSAWHFYAYRHPDIIVFCLVLGEVPAKEKLFVVVITENISTILCLKSAIKKEKEPDLDYFASNMLTLWKVNIPINNEDRLKILDDVSCTVDIEQDLGGIKLFLADGILEDFYEQQPPSVKIIHIIIQVPATDSLGDTMLPYSTDHETFEGISLNDPDISYRSKVVFSLVKDLIKKKIILVRAPLYSGKISLAQLMEYYLINLSEYYSSIGL
ncbi:crinkler family protein [Gigaspora margarita]|uniref:Crinkler family protein n=1 Tax=Gigaspora margarita TaxID=4874 RepID=A0A8H4ATF3_GIGMA|nr:crinkler family protein [Gigaspora margarita]